MTEISIQNPRNYRSVEVVHLGSWLGHLIDSLAPGSCSVGVRFVDDSEMRRLNKAYRQRDSATDVLSFPGSDSMEGHHLGDLVIAIPTARRQASSNGVSEQYEIRSLLLHGVLHCLGFDHETDEGEMDAIEARLREEWLADVD